MVLKAKRLTHVVRLGVTGNNAKSRDATAATLLHDSGYSRYFEAV